MNELVARRHFLNRLSLGLIGLAGAAVAVPLVGYVLSPLLRPPRQAWIDMGPLADLPQGQTVLRTAVDPGALKWAGQTADWAVWVRRSGDQAFTVFAINCAHLGCPVSWSADANLFLCPCHGGVYYADGTVAGGPPPRPLFQYETRVQNGRLQVLSRPLGIG